MSLEQEKAEGDSDDEYTEELLKELREDMVKVKESLKLHVDNSHNLQTMSQRQIGLEMKRKRLLRRALQTS